MSFREGFEKHAALTKVAGVGFDIRGYTSDANTVADHYREGKKIKDGMKWIDHAEELETKHGKTSGTPDGAYKYNLHIMATHGPSSKILNALAHDTNYASEPRIRIFDKVKDREKIESFLKAYKDSIHPAHQDRVLRTQHPGPVGKFFGQKPKEISEKGLDKSQRQYGEKFLAHADRLMKDPKIKSVAFEFE